MYHKAGDTANFQHYATIYLDNAKDDYWALDSWVDTWRDRPECDINNPVYYENVQHRMLEVENTTDCYAHAYMRLADLRYKQGDTKAAAEYYNMLVNTLHNLNARNEIDETGGVFYPYLNVEALMLGQKLRKLHNQ